MDRLKVTGIIFGLLCTTAVAFEPVVVDVPSDPKAKYTILDIQLNNGNKLSIVSKRNGHSRESFARRLVNCADNTFRYTGDADTLDELNSQNLSGSMGPLVDGSISDVISKFACRKV
jgi:hypothetical protein